MKSQKVKVCAVWYTCLRDPANPSRFRMTPDDDEGILLNASIGKKRITVWLPSGKRVVTRIGILGLRRTFTAHYWRDQFDFGREIRCTILGCEPKREK